MGRHGNCPTFAARHWLVKSKIALEEARKERQEKSAEAAAEKGLISKQPTVHLVASSMLRI